MVHDRDSLSLPEARCGAMLEHGSCGEITSWRSALLPFTRTHVPNAWGRPRATDVARSGAAAYHATSGARGLVSFGRSKVLRIGAIHLTLAWLDRPGFPIRHETRMRTGRCPVWSR